MLNSYSSFRYGHEITNINNLFSFDEGSGELNAELRVGSYTLTDFASELSRAMNEVSEIENNYETTIDYENGLITVSGDANFSILLSSSTLLALSVFSLVGFTSTLDLSGANSYQGDSRSGKIYFTQYPIQDFVDLDERESLAAASINIPANGNFVETITYGDERILEANLKYVTDIPMAEGAPIRNRPNGKAELVDLLRSLIRKQPIEFCKDENDQISFNKLILEETSGNRTGTGYFLKRMRSQKLRDYFEIKLTFREIS